MIVGLGSRTDHIATVPHADPVRLNLSPDETQVFACVGRVARIDEVLERCGLPEARAIAVMLSLRAKGAIAPARVQKSESRVADVDAVLLEDVDLDLERKKELLELERSLERIDHFALLKIPASSDATAAKLAFYEASRRFHPDRYFGKNLGSYRARLERIYRKITEAHEVLTHPDRRREYLAKHPELLAAVHAGPPLATPPPTSAQLFDDEPSNPGSPESRARADERRARFARHPYLAKGQKVNELVASARAAAASGEFDRAIAELTMVSQLDPKNRDAPALLSEVKKKSDLARAKRELEEAKQAEQSMDPAGAMRHYRIAATLDDQNAELAYRTARLMVRSNGDLKEAKLLAQRAVELDPRNAEHHFLLGTLVLEAGLKKVAKRHFEEAVKLQPEHAEAKAQLKKLRWTF